MVLLEELLHRRCDRIWTLHSLAGLNSIFVEQLVADDIADWRHTGLHSELEDLDVVVLQAFED